MIRIQQQTIAAAKEYDAFAAGLKEPAGAIILFAGRMRGQEKGKALASMLLEHYPAMSQRELAAMAQKARRQFKLAGVRIIHRTGRIAPDEIIVLVLTASPHRAEAFAAAGFLMDWLKNRAPFWKKLEYQDGQTQWAEQKASDRAAVARWQD